MKKIILLLFTLMILPIIVSAHTGLSSSNPTEGQVVTEDLDQILLNYATTIEKLSTMNLVKDGNTIPLKAVKVENKQLIGEISKPLENGSYTIQWNIIGEDGHPIKGEINFSVQKESVTNTEQPNEDQVTNEDNNQAPQTDQEEEEPKTTGDDADVADEENSSSSSTNILLTVFIGLLVIFGIGLLIFFYKKRK